MALCLYEYYSFIKEDLMSISSIKQSMLKKMKDFQ